MMKCRLVSVILFMVAAFSASVHAEESQDGPRSQVRIGKTITYPASHGDVVFDHDMHVDELKGESCAPCHRANSPMGKETLARLDARRAHYFCKGCHRERGRGPTECHGCHKIQPK